MRVLRGEGWPQGHPDTEDVVLPTSGAGGSYRPSTDGQRLAVIPSRIPPRDPSGPRPPAPLGEAAQQAARHRRNWLTTETLAAGVHHGHALWFGTERNVRPGDRQRSRPSSASRSTSPDRRPPLPQRRSP